MARRAALRALQGQVRGQTGLLRPREDGEVTRRAAVAQRLGEVTLRDLQPRAEVDLHRGRHPGERALLLQTRGQRVRDGGCLQDYDGEGLGAKAQRLKARMKSGSCFFLITPRDRA